MLTLGTFCVDAGVPEISPYPFTVAAHLQAGGGFEDPGPPPPFGYTKCPITVAHAVHSGRCSIVYLCIVFSYLNAYINQSIAIFVGMFLPCEEGVIYSMDRHHIIYFAVRGRSKIVRLK